MRGMTTSAMLTMALAASIPAAMAARHSATAEPEAASATLKAPNPDEIRFICSRQKKLGDFLAQLDPGVPHTIRVVGACRENLVLSGFARLMLLAAPGASISDASGGMNYVLQTLRSSTVELQGFLINGSVACLEDSTCFFVTDRFRGGNFVDGGEGVLVVRSYADFLAGSVIEDSDGNGVSVLNGALVRADGLTVQNAGGNGMLVLGGSHLTVYFSTIQNNGGDGIRVRVNGSVRVFDGTIQGNAVDGIEVISGSDAQLLTGETGVSIINNGNVGVSVGDLSFVEFAEGANVTGNLSGADVQCMPQFSATRGALTNINGGSTNCVEP
jgi:hypothetical protein